MTFLSKDSIDALLFPCPALEKTEEMQLGLRELRRRLTAVRQWHTEPSPCFQPAEFLQLTDASSVLVILNPAILLSDNLIEELLWCTNQEQVCALPSDPRGYASDLVIDYASRPGFDRFVARLVGSLRHSAFDEREPWIYLVKRTALEALSKTNRELQWQEIPRLLSDRTVIANHSFVHSWADYHLNTRAEMLLMLPHTVNTLLDVGGGAGNFAHAFVRERGGQATLLELNAEAAELARAFDINVVVGDFNSLSAGPLFDCVTMLDVLEHLSNPLLALQHAHEFLRDEGYLLLSVPNAGHWSVIWDLLEGEFSYQPVGILCNTHLRFFTRRSLEQLLKDAGFKVERWENITTPIPHSFAEFLHARITTGVQVDLESVETESFHVLARRRVLS